jgi:hypothetical protein
MHKTPVTRLMKKTISTALFIAFASFAAQGTKTVANFDITTDFSHPVHKHAAGGGGCAGTPIIRKIVNREKSEQRISDIYTGDAFVEDNHCNMAERISISINNKAYPIYANSKKAEFKDGGFMTSYINKKEDIKVAIKHLKILKKEYDPDTECTTYNRKVQLDISFKGKEKTFYGVTDSGCP